MLRSYSKYLDCKLFNANFFSEKYSEGLEIQSGNCKTAVSNTMKIEIL